MNTETIMSNDVVIAENTEQIIANQALVFEAGQKAEYDRFWDKYQNNGEKSSYSHAFAMWDEELITPKYDITPSDCARMFYYSTISGDLDAFFERQGRKIDFTKLTSTSALVSTFRASKLTKIGAINASACTQLAETFMACTDLKTIELLNMGEKITSIGTTTFSSCTSLENITITGTILRSFNISYSPLTAESAKSIITQLEFYLGTSDEMKYTVSFHESVWTLLDAETDAPNGTNWREMVTDRGWNF